MPRIKTAFWREKTLAELNPSEWESLCDGCAKCCLHKLEDVDTRRVLFTNVHCRLLDTATGRCGDYAHRTDRVPDCVRLTPEVLADPYWLPESCAYRRLAEGRDLSDWHPLITGDPLSVERAGQRLCDRTISEEDAGELSQHLATWIT